MALLAGIWSKTDAAPEPADVAALERALARSGDAPTRHARGRLTLLRIAPCGPTHAPLVDAGARLAAGAGRPLLGESASEDDLRTLAADLPGSLDRLVRCRGQFSLVSTDGESLTLATDWVGVRPLYVHDGERQLVFASALRVLEDVPSIALRMDRLGVLEQIGFGYPLGDRTPYANVRRLRSGEVWTVRGERVERRVPSRMDDVAESGQPAEKLVDEAYELFLDATRLRVGAEAEPISFLSGGLDSRCIAAALAATGRRVPCVNFRRPGQLDTTLARRFAEALDLTLIEQEVPEDERQFVSKGLAFGRLQEAGRFGGHEPVVFSGDGGSVGTGHAYLDPEHVERMRAGDPAGAAAFALSRRGRPARTAFGRRERRRVTAAVERSITAELESLTGVAEPGRKYHVYLMQNDQRRHLDHHYEHLDRYRTELATPFFDTRFLRCILSVPLERAMRHGFYYEWLERFPAPVREIPWQAYPGHLPCPVALDADDRGARSQWQPTRREQFDRVRDAFRVCAGVLARGGPPRGCGVGRARAAGVLALHAMRIRNGMGLFKVVNEFDRVAARCAGRFEPLPEGDARPDGDTR